MTPLLLALLGLAVGPLLGVIVDRAVERERLEPEHRCTSCGVGMGWMSLMPVGSWFVRCPNDRSHRNWRYPITDILTAIAFAVAGARFGLSWQLWPYVLLFAALVVMSVIDAETHLLLDILTWPALGIGVFLVLTLSGLNDYEAGIWPALIGAGLYGGIIFAAYRIYPPGMGLGDAKLAPTLGLFLGWLSTTNIGAVRLVFYALVLALLGAGRGSEVPLGPALAAAAIVVIAVSEDILSDLAT